MRRRLNLDFFRFAPIRRAAAVMRPARQQPEEIKYLLHNCRGGFDGA
jgi:hypothetical protein